MFEINNKDVDCFFVKCLFCAVKVNNQLMKIRPFLTTYHGFHLAVFFQNFFVYIQWHIQVPGYSALKWTELRIFMA